MRGLDAVLEVEGHLDLRASSALTTSFRLLATVRKAPSTNRLTAIVPDREGVDQTAPPEAGQGLLEEVARGRAATAIASGIIIAAHGRSWSGSRAARARARRRSPRSCASGLGPERCVTLAQDSYYKDGSALDARGPGRDQLRPPRRLRHARCWSRTCATCKAGRPVPHLTYDHATYSRRVLPDPLHAAAGHPPRGHPHPGRGAAAAADGHQALHRHRRRRADPAAPAARPQGARPHLRVGREAVPRARCGPMHLEFVEPSKRYADLIIPEGAENEVALEAVRRARPRDAAAAA